ncbi:uncharacterized protein LOC121860951 [Homarus americanus]|uniref:Putative P53 DNA-binding domain-containing protein 2 n=1 Tax=Homarus americanus TaxID=6706 RepID=A0A8J5N4B6_HOMAM|nr:uncharacterized protein LOC121860951 [Homarus americanus]XP_042214288.1 uncharacterized protein LOC121860951 [Homarus americanus]XP_042214289.1 uncharacterized protein LOC121860951 [Homarus americanus]KAG7173045.1 putative P53 DNA-binding domain-containing protein 2 [Homarus americanus]
MQCHPQQENITLARYSDVGTVESMSGFPGGIDMSFPHIIMEEDEPEVISNLEIAKGARDIKIEDYLELPKDTVVANNQLQRGYTFVVNSITQEPFDLPEVTIASNELPGKDLEAKIQTYLYDYDINLCIKPIPSEKKKNPPYLVERDIITTQNRTPVFFKIEGTKAGQKVTMSMRYIDELHKDTPVNSCRNHQDFPERPSILPQAFNFFMTNTCNYEVDNAKHPIATYDIQGNDFDDEGNLKISIVLLCLNSCHREKCKKLVLRIGIYDPVSNISLKEDCFTIRCCKNVKRDHKNKTGTKRSTIATEDDQTEEIVPVKVQKVEVQGCGTHQQPCQDSSVSNEENGRPWHLFQMKSETDEQYIHNLIERLGGTWSKDMLPFETDKEQTYSTYV